MDTTTLPRHARTGIQALGWRRPRPGETGPQPIWPILGGDGTAEDNEDEGAGGEDEGAREESGEEGDDAPLGEAGTRALAAEKARRKAEADRRRKAEEHAADLEAKLVAATRKEGKPDVDQIRREAATAATTKANERIVRSEVRAAAAGKLSDPKDALRFLDLGKFEVDEDGQVDEDEIAEAIDDLLKNKPYLAAQSGRRFQGSGDGGARNGSSVPAQVTEAELDKMTPDQIEKARIEGRLNDLLGVKR